MTSRIFWVPVFIGGMAVGALITHLLLRMRGAQKTRAILTHAKEQQENDIRREIFTATEAVHNELTRSLRLLRNSTQKLLLVLQEDRNRDRKTTLP